MKRKKLIQLATLLAISDASELPADVYDRVARRLAAVGISVGSTEIRMSLIELIESGFAKAYWLGPGPQREIDGVPPPADFQDYYFFRTDEGLRIIPVWRKHWPFDDVGDLLPEWSLLIDREDGERTNRKPGSRGTAWVAPLADFENAPRKL